MADSESPSAAPPALRLESPESPTGQAGVAALYGVDVRKVKRWVAAGREAADPPPLHSPVHMRAWHDRLRERGIFKQRCGPEFDRASARLAASAATSVNANTSAPAAAELPAPAPAPITSAASTPSAASTSTPSTPSTPSTTSSLPELITATAGDIDIDLASFDSGSVDFDDGVAAAKMNFIVQARLLQKAFTSTSEDERRRARIAFTEALDLYRQVERDREKIMASSGRLLKRDTVRRELLDLHNNIAARLRASLREDRLDIATAAQTPESWATYCERKVHDICRTLVETRFAAPDSNTVPAPSQNLVAA